MSSSSLLLPPPAAAAAAAAAAVVVVMAVREMRSDLETVLDDMEEERAQLERVKAREEKRATLMALPRRQSGKLSVFLLLFV